MVRDRNATEPRLDIAFHIPSMKGNDVNAVDLAADILGARDNSRLVRDLKLNKGIVNSISAYSLTPKEPGLFTISATSLPKISRLPPRVSWRNWPAWPRLPVCRRTEGGEKAN